MYDVYVWLLICVVALLVSEGSVFSEADFQTRLIVQSEISAMSLSSKIGRRG